MNQATVADLLGKRVLVGVTYVEPDGLGTDHRQFLGVVERADAEGIVLRRTDVGGEFRLPADPALLKRAAAGRYRLRRTGEVVVDPDLLCALRVAGRPDDRSEASRVA